MAQEAAVDPGPALTRYPAEALGHNGAFVDLHRSQAKVSMPPAPIAADRRSTRGGDRPPPGYHGRHRTDPRAADGPLHTRSGASSGPQTLLGSTTYVPGRGPGAPPSGRRYRNNTPVCEATPEVVRSNPCGRKKRPKIFLLRDHAPGPVTALRTAVPWPWPPAGGRARRGGAVDAPVDLLGAVAVVVLPATASPLADTRDSGSTAGSTAAACTGGRSPYGNRPAGRGRRRLVVRGGYLRVGCWKPTGGATPLGQARGGSLVPPRALLQVTATLLSACYQ